MRKHVISTLVVSLVSMKDISQSQVGKETYMRTQELKFLSIEDQTQKHCQIINRLVVPLQENFQPKKKCDD